MRTLKQLDPKCKVVFPQIDNTHTHTFARSSVTQFYSIQVADALIFMISFIIQGLFKIKIQFNMCEQEKKQQRIYDLINAENQAKVSLSIVYKAKKKIYRKRAF